MDIKKKKIFGRPAIHTTSSQIDVEAISTLTAILSHNGRIAPDLNYRDTWPNTDGYLEITTNIGVPDGKLEAQVKKVNIRNGKVSFSFDDDKLINYCKTIRDLPVLFIGVDLKKQKAYWVEMTPQYVSQIKGRTIHIPIKNVIARGSTPYYKQWKAICDNRKKILEKALMAFGIDSRGISLIDADSQKTAISQLFEFPPQSDLLNKNIKAVNSIVENIKEKILLYEGHLFLVSPTYINNSDIRSTIRNNLGISSQQEELFIDELFKKEILTKTGDVVVFAEDALGQEKLLYLLENDLIQIGKVYDSFPDNKVRKNILSKIASFQGIKQVDLFFKSLIVDFRRSLEGFDNNDAIIVNLELLNEYSFRVSKETIGLVNNILNLKRLPPKTYKNKLGEFQGASREKLITEVLNVLHNIRYLEIESVFKIASRLSIYDNTEIKKKALELIKNISEYNIFAIRKIGYYPQKRILELIKLWSKPQRQLYQFSLLEIGREILSAEFEGSQMTDYKTFTLSFGPLVASEELKMIRNGISEIIKQFYTECKNTQVKQKLLNVLEDGSRTPSRGTYSDELEKLILDFVNSELMPFYSDIIIGETLVLIHEIEEQLYWFIKRFGKEKIRDIEKLQQKLIDNKQYQVFRVFYGYDLDFNEELSWREAKDRREKIIDTYVTSISIENFPAWKNDILVVASNYSDKELGKFQYFNSFLYHLAKQKPSLAIGLLDYSDSLHPFLTQLVFGLWESEFHEKIRKTLLAWSRDSKELEMIAGLFWFTKKIDMEIAIQVFNSASRQKDIPALTVLIRSLIVSYQGEDNIKKLFLDVVRRLTELNNVGWVFNLFMRESKLFEALTGGESDILINNLLLVEDIDYNVEEIITGVAKNFPKKVIKYFEERISQQIRKNRGVRYDAVPYSFHELPQFLEKQPQIVIEEVSKWFKKKGWLYKLDGPRFLKAIFPSMNEPLKRKLLALIEEGGNANADIVLSILRAYEGESFLHFVTKAFIKRYLRGEKSKHYKGYLTELFILLSATGVVSGEYGLPNAYKQKKEEIQSWKSDKSKSVQKFVKEYEKYLDRDIAYHTKRADEDIELMKRGAM